MRNEFYEDDEPVDEVVAAFDRGQKIMTDSGRGSRTTHLPSGAILGKVPATYGLCAGGMSVLPFTHVRVTVGTPALVG